DYKEFEENHGERKASESPNGNYRWVIGAIAALLVIGLALGYGYQQQIRAGHLEAQESMAASTINDLQRQLNATTDKLNGVIAAQQAAADAAAAQKANQPAGKTGSGNHSAARPGSGDKRYKQLQAQLTEQQKQLKETQDLVAKNRTDLEGSLSS